MASRRASDRLIQAGQVTVNGLRVLQPGTLVDPEADRVSCEGRVVRLPERFTYLLLNKPPGYIVSARDPHHKRTVYHLLEDVPERIFPVGRLDRDTWGVLLFTNDGDLSHRLTHPAYEVIKTYRVAVKGRPSAEAVRRLRRGVRLEDGVTSPARAQLVKASGESSVLELSLHEGRKREVKRMCAAVGHPVRQLERTAFAGLTAGGLEAGQWRHLTGAEVRRLKRMVGLEETPS